MSVLVTGGAGYIGSQTCVELLRAGYEVVVVDNLSNASEKALDRVRKITGKDLTFVKGDICDESLMRSIFEQNKGIEVVIHFAALKAVGESVMKPLDYYYNNLTGLLTVLRVMRDFGVKQFVFSSSATVYGDPASVPVNETFPTSATNPYGYTKLMAEQILSDIVKTSEDFSVVALRYFNPIGADESGLIGENPNGIPNNLVPYIAKVAVGKLDKLSVTGADYDTPDGTGVRDYIHIVDLAKGHIKALEKAASSTGLKVYNLGTGKGTSVLEMVAAFSKACGKEIPYEIVPRRPGDIASVYADCSLAEKELGWKAELDIDKMCADTWNWQSKNPNGYEED